jgi:dimethylamine monooxygenase subunit A
MKIERSMSSLPYTPYDGSSQPFTIGLSQLAAENWIEPDERLPTALAEKARLLGAHREAIFRAEAGTEAAQGELLALLCDYLPARYPEIYRLTGDRMEIAGAPDVDLANETVPALIRAGLLVGDDLVLMRRGDKGWRIAAAFVAFPSSWSLEEKFGRVMDEVHAEVPDFEGGSRNAELINRMFDKLPGDRLVSRMNWSVNATDELFLPKSKSQRVMADVPPAAHFLRVERQTLRKLQTCGDIVFTIRIYLDPLAQLAREADAARLMTSLAAQLAAMTPAQAAYKGLLHKRDAMIDLLKKAAESGDYSPLLP